MIIMRKIVGIDIWINDNDEIVCSVPNRCIFDVERKANEGLRLFSLKKNQQKLTE
jgi:hypothetical protein